VAGLKNDREIKKRCLLLSGAEKTPAPFTRDTVSFCGTAVVNRDAAKRDSIEETVFIDAKRRPMSTELTTRRKQFNTRPIYKQPEPVWINKAAGDHRRSMGCVRVDRTKTPAWRPERPSA